MDASAAVRSWGEAVTAILNLRGRNENSGWKVDHWRIASHQMRGSSISAGAAAGEGSEVMLRMQLPEVWMACMPDLGQLVQDVRRVAQLDPVELEVGAGGEVAVALVVAAGDGGQACAAGCCSCRP